MKKSIKNLLILLLILSISMIYITGCGNESNNSETLKAKVDSEMSFLDTQLIDMLNELNGISFVNYVVTAQEVKESESTSSNAKEENSSEQSSNSGGSSGGESNSSGSTESSGQEGGAKSTQALDYSMNANGILLEDRATDWNGIKYDIEQMYTSWSTIILDLYKLNINNEDILAFSDNLDLVTKAIKDENKKDSLVLLAKLYSYLPKYVESYSDNTNKINVLKTKSNVLNAYAIIEDNKPDEVKKQIDSAEQSYLPIVNNIETNTNMQYNINKAYILLKELQGSLDTTDSDIFYIKYRNLIQELNIIQ